MSEYIEVGQPLQFTDPNTPTRVGEVVENVSDIYNIPSPRLGMQVFVKSEKKSFVITSLKNKVIGGVDVPEAAVEAFEPVGAKSITWNNDTDPSNMNDFVVAGVYDIKGEHKRVDDNLPILNIGGGHSFNARLTVLDSSISGSGKNDDKCITQVLSFSNRLGQGEVYIRTGKGASLDNLTWENWSTLQRNVNVGEVDSLDDLKDNGIYSGVWKQGRLNPIYLAFVCIVIKDYFIGTAPRRVSQFVYGLSKSDGSVVYQSRVWDDSENKWSDWEILNQKEIASMISAEIKKVTDGIDPNKIDSLKDIIVWIEEHGDVANILAAIGGLSDGLGQEIEARISADNDIRRKGVLFGGFSHRQTTANEVVIGYKDIDQNYEGAFTIPAATTEKAGVMTAADKAKLDSLSPGGGGGGGGVAELMVEVTYSELVALRDNASLVAGMKYRITDYVTTTVQQDTKSANHPFDVIVEAVSENELSELAQAIQHDGDTYFDDNDLGAWQLWYDLDNNTDKYEWADAENGKGVIYRMIDEKKNDCPYDFKNIIFLGGYSDGQYTFFHSTTGDYSVVAGDKCYNNVIKAGGGNRLPFNVFMVSDSSAIHGNTIGIYSEKNLLKGNCLNNTLGDDCRNNHLESTINCYLGSYSSNNTLIAADYNTIGHYCYNNQLTKASSNNTLKDSCKNNVLHENCKNNVLHENCSENSLYNSSNNTLEAECSFNSFSNTNTCHLGSSCKSNIFSINYSIKIGYNCANNDFRDCANNIIGNNCNHNEFSGYNSSIFGYGLHDKHYTLRNRTSITLNKEYYDDGTDALVPIKHPDLSTQPSILPYKFMGQYVYEQLIPLYDVPTPSGYGFNKNDLAVPTPLFIDAKIISLSGGYIYDSAWIREGSDYGYDYLIDSYKHEGGYMTVTDGYAKIVYTSMPKEEGDYYGYNNY